MKFFIRSYRIWPRLVPGAHAGDVVQIVETDSPATNKVRKRKWNRRDLNLRLPSRGGKLSVGEKPLDVGLSLLLGLGKICGRAAPLKKVKKISYRSGLTSNLHWAGAAEAGCCVDWPSWSNWPPGSVLTPIRSTPFQWFNPFSKIPKVFLKN